MKDPRLENLRAEIAHCDEEILDLAARRLKAAAEVGRIKSEGAVPIRNYPVEARVLERMRAGCLERKLDPELGVGLAELLIDQAVKLQTGFRDLSTKSGSGEVLVVGGLGKMGRWLSAYFHATGHRVRVLDTCEGESDFERVSEFEAAAETADLVALSVPISTIPELLGRLDSARHQGLILDIASLKSPLVAPLREAAARGLHVASVHPMFGPDALHLVGRNILLCDCGAAGALTEAKALFEDVGAQLIELPLAEHDRHMGYVLGLAHLVNLLYGRVLAGSGLDFATLGEVASTTFGKQNATALDVLRENPDLYFEIQSLNATTPELAASLHAALDEVLSAVGEGDRESFRRIMEEGRRYFLGESR